MEEDGSVGLGAWSVERAEKLNRNAVKMAQRQILKG
jgi:hypothetical protein